MIQNCDLLFQNEKKKSATNQRLVQRINFDGIQKKEKVLFFTNRR